MNVQNDREWEKDGDGRIEVLGGGGGMYLEYAGEKHDLLGHDVVDKAEGVVAGSVLQCIQRVLYLLRNGELLRPL